MIAKRFGVRYPWGQWFGRGKFTLRKDRDYTCATHGMAQMVRNTAGRLGVRVHIQVGNDLVKVRVV